MRVEQPPGSQSPKQLRAETKSQLIQPTSSGERPIEILPTIEVGPSEFERRPIIEKDDIEVVPLIVSSSAEASPDPKKSQTVKAARAEATPNTEMTKKGR